MVFSNMLLVFMISLQFGMYRLMIDNSLKVFTGHMQVQAPSYNDDQKMRQVVPDVADLATSLRELIGTELLAERAAELGARLRGRIDPVADADRLVAPALR